MSVFAAAVAILAAGLYSGAAWYLSLVELPAQLAGTAEAGLAQWARSVRLTPRYAASALVATAAGLIAGRAALASPWTWGAGAIFCVLPFTVVAILPTQRRLLAEGSGDIAGLQRWGRLHAVRTVLGLLATLLFLWAALAKAGAA